MTLLVLDGSGRPNGISNAWTKDILGQYESVERLNVREMTLNHCTGCLSCFKTGQCIFKDDFFKFEEAFERCDALIVTSPLYFNGIPSVFKTLIDRCEVYYARKVLLKMKMPLKKGLIVMSAGMNRIGDFDGALSTLKLFLLALNIKEYNAVLLPGTDDKSWLLEEDELKKIKSLVKSL